MRTTPTLPPSLHSAPSLFIKFFSEFPPSSVKETHGESLPNFWARTTPLQPFFLPTQATTQSQLELRNEAYDPSYKAFPYQ
ncbi:hypothetical protein C1H46_036314 [Malus baccata]|uniref:Uncharacterized protein n=1 Tax=Malus baccata TaxID=106549 RepID=A0A540KV88_MALBA|nr:hypothetical protein C1H46_036314 [Malus baccata]